LRERKVKKFEFRELPHKLKLSGLSKEFDGSWALRLYLQNMQGVSATEEGSGVLVRVHYREKCDPIYYRVLNIHGKFIEDDMNGSWFPLNSDIVEIVFPE